MFENCSGEKYLNKTKKVLKKLFTFGHKDIQIDFQHEGTIIRSTNLEKLLRFHIDDKKKFFLCDHGFKSLQICKSEPQVSFPSISNYDSESIFNVF